MLKKLCLGTLLIIFAFIGFTQAQKELPNQEIVIQFNNDEVSSVDANSAIAIVKKQLQSIGITALQVRELQNGQLKISYYSGVDVASVKHSLSSKNDLEISFASNKQDRDQSNLPFDKHQKTFNLDVYKIQDSNDSNTGFDGKLAIEIKSESDRFFNPIVDNLAAKIEERKRDRIIKVTLKVNRTIAIAIDNTSYKIPEVRAGPHSIRIS